MHKTTGKTIEHAAGVAFDAASLLTPDDLPGFLAEVMQDGDTLALPLALRTAADVMGMTELARRTGLNRETLYRTLSAGGNPRLDTLAAILRVFDLRLTLASVVTKPRRTRVGKHAAAERPIKRAKARAASGKSR